MTSSPRSPDMHSIRKVAVLLFDEFDLLDFSGPYEVFSAANRGMSPRAFSLYTVAEEPNPDHGGLSLSVHYSLEDCPQPDILIIPGGYGTRKLVHNARLIEWIKNRATRAELVLSVCTGALLLAKSGLLDGLEATTHHAAIELLRKISPRITVRDDCRLVDNGKIVTSAGIASGIDMALHVVSRLLGTEHALEVAEHLEYQWQPTEVPCQLQAAE